ncbi:hypothetical protein ACJMK2_037678 [Sinanodonta woodiana]|uniref:B box-type domain-containing protein n=1 Tax=Sinanodonta woodiana TaxID=1069815 RepID=A0ABD3WPP0_SINWO
MSPEKEAATDKTCESCYAHGKKLKARYFCTVCRECRCRSCYEHHQSSKLFKGHTIVTLKRYPSVSAMAVTIAESLTCTNHGDEKYKFFCSEHGEVMFAICRQEGHNGCTNCKDIIVHAKEVIKEQRPDKLLKKMKALQKHITDVSKRKSQNMLDFEADIKKLKEISTLRHTINSIIDDLEIRVNEEGKKVIEQQSMRRLEEDGHIQSLVAAVKNSCKHLEAITNYGSETQVCVVLQKMEDVPKRKSQNMLDFEADIKKKLNEISTLRHTINSIIDNLEIRVNEEGKKVIEQQSMRRLEEDGHIQSLVAAVKNSCKHLEAITNYGSETQVCVVLQKMEDQLLAYQTKTIDCSEILKINIDLNIHDCLRESISENRQIIRLPHDFIQFHSDKKALKERHMKANETDDKRIHRKNRERISDRGRRYMLPVCLYDSCYRYLSEYKLSSSSRRMAVVAKNGIAISLPDQMKIHFLLIGNTITSKRTTSNTRWCTSLASLSNTELVFTGYKKNRCPWGIMTTDGQEKSCLHIMTPATGGTNVILNSLKTRVCISYYLNNAVYSDMAIDLQENLFVVGHESCNIHQLAQNGSVLKLITDGIPRFPVSISLNTSGKQFLLTSVDDTNRDTCFVYQLK